MILLTLIGLTSLNSANATENGLENLFNQIATGASQIPSYIAKTGGYLFSRNGAKDLALAYLLGMGLTAIHEFGHAITSKIFYGTPIQLVLGATPRSNHPSYIQIGGITLGGFNPTIAYANAQLSDASPLKSATVLAAGPIFGALSSLGAYILLSKYDGLYIAKAAALFGLFNHTLGKAGIGGTWTPGTDAHRFVESLKQYRNSQTNTTNYFHDSINSFPKR